MANGLRKKLLDFSGTLNHFTVELASRDTVRWGLKNTPHGEDMFFV